MKKILPLLFILGLSIKVYANGECLEYDAEIYDKTLYELFSNDGVKELSDGSKTRINSETNKLKMQAELESTTAISDAITTEGLGGSKEDFTNPLTLIGFDSSGDSNQDGENGNRLGFEYSFPFSRESSMFQSLKVGAAANQQPTAFNPLIESLDEDGREATRTLLEDRLDIRDDWQLTLSYAFNRGSIGRHGKMVDEIFDGLQQASDVELDAALATIRSYPEIISRANRMDGEAIDADTTLNQIEFSGADSEGLSKRLLCESIVKLKRVEEEWRTSADESSKRLSEIAKLADNQPQLLFSVTRNLRNTIAGPDAQSYKLTYEWGYRANLSKLKRYIDEQQCETSSCYSNAYTTYLDENKSIIEAQDRLALSLEFEEVDSYRFIDDSLTADFERPRAQKFVGKLAVGRTLNNPLMEGSRLEFSIRYEDVDADPTLNDRTVATLSLIKKIGELSFPVSLIYSNRPEYVEMETNSQLTAGIGIKYEFGQQKKD